MESDRPSAAQPSGTLASNTVARLIPASSWPQQHPWPSIGGLRHLIFYAKTNGFETVIRRVGRRVLIDEAAFFAWVNRQGTK